MTLDQVHLGMLRGLRGEKREAFLEGLRVFGIPNPEARVNLKESFRRLRPDFSEQHLDIAVRGRGDTGNVKGLGDSRRMAGKDSEGALAQAVKAWHPEWTDEQVAIFVRGR